MYLINSCTDRRYIYTRIYKDTGSQTQPQAHVRAQKHTQTPAHMLRHCQQPGRHTRACAQTGPGSQLGSILKPGPLLPASCQLLLQLALTPRLSHHPFICPWPQRASPGSRMAIAPFSQVPTQPSFTPPKWSQASRACYSPQGISVGVAGGSQNHLH